MAIAKLPSSSPFDRKNSNSIFIRYATEDVGFVFKLYKDLKDRGLNPWLDKEELLPDKHIREIQKSCKK